MIEDNSLGLEFKYLIVNDMDRKFGLWVNTVGYQSIPPDSPYPLKEHPSGYFFNAEKGRGASRISVGLYHKRAWFVFIRFHF